MEFKGTLIVVKDIEKAVKFYHDLFGLEVVADNDGNIVLANGLFLQDAKFWKGFINKDITEKSNSAELYFEEENIEEFVEKLEKLYPDIEYVNRIMTHSWGQTVVRFYDLDGNLIEVGTPMEDLTDEDDDFDNMVKEYNDSVGSFCNNYRALNRFVMNNTIECCNSDIDLFDAIYDSVAKQYIVYDYEEIDATEDAGTSNIIVSKKRSFEAAATYKGKKTAVLNFANNHSVGGAPWSAGAQEESLCRCSTLYPCLNAASPDFHEKHKKLYQMGGIDNWGNDDLIYTPNVVVFKSDESAPKIMSKGDRFAVDVITSAAPELYGYYDKDEFRKAISSRIEKIIKVAKKENVEALILGAYGCGAFNNPPEIVAQEFKKLLQKYHFDIVEFAVYCYNDMTNYEIFKNTFLEK